ncbi:unnamed protein product [Durusdinium trenchii]|uniref:Uncharacterized protein n=1 Tax=Durusdinium trenchii TaxID=1381693 RepID=A0ABP0KDP8_9DINO
MSELPDEDRQETTGSVRKLVGRQCRQVVEESPFEALIEGYDEWRRDHQMRTLQLDILAPMLATWNITVWRLDFGVNEVWSWTLEVSHLQKKYLSWIFWLLLRACKCQAHWSKAAATEEVGPRLREGSELCRQAQ